jgi:hypothetical protein
MPGNESVPQKMNPLGGIAKHIAIAMAPLGEATWVASWGVLQNKVAVLGLGSDPDVSCGGPLRCWRSLRRWFAHSVPRRPK